MSFVRNTLLVAFALVSMFTPAAAQDAPMQINGATTVNAPQIFDLVSNLPNLVIVDNRKAEDFNSGHLEGAKRLIDTDVSADTLARLIPSKDTPVLFYCNGVKCGRAAKATQKAIELGYTKIYYYALGMDEWNKEGLPLAQ